MTKIAKKDAVLHERAGVKGWYYQFPEIEGGTTMAYAQFTGGYGERTVGNRARIYYVLEGGGEFMLNGDKFPFKSGDAIAVPANSTYNFWPKGDAVKVLLVMELLDISKLPK